MSSVALSETTTRPWHLLQDKRVLVLHMMKWHRLKAGNVRDASRTWWRKCLMSEEPFTLKHPHGDYYNEKDK